MKAALAALVLVTAGCSLPLPDGVHVSREAPAFDAEPADIQVMPPGPQANASPEAIVRGFLGAESSPDGDYEVARKFLTPKAGWKHDEVLVYDPATLKTTAPRSASLAVVVSVSFTQIGVVDREGRYASVPRTPVTETYPLKQDAQRQWRIEDPPRGIRLTPADRDRSYPARRLYFLSLTPRATLHVVPDQVLLPAGGPPGRAELTRLLEGPSLAIADSVTTGFPEGTQLVSVVSRTAGLYDVTLSPHVLSATDLQRQSLSAQVVWTLRGLDPRFRGVRITASGKPLKVPGVGELQGPEDWEVLDPEGLTAGPAYFVAGNRVQSLTNSRRAAGPDATRDLPVQSVAVSPDRTQVAVLNRDQLRRGPADGRTLPLVPLRYTGLRSPSWGTGDRGLWLLDGRGQVLLVDPINRVRVASTPGIEGRITWLAISRDGVRGAFVINGALYVGRVTPAGQPVAIVGATRIASDVSGVTRVAWRDPTTLVVLGRLPQSPVLPVLVAVDGSTVRPLPVAGLPDVALEVAASSLGVLVTADRKLFQLSSLGFRPGPAGEAPAYPG